jgi:hypothetical protein
VNVFIDTFFADVFSSLLDWEICSLIIISLQKGRGYWLVSFITRSVISHWNISSTVWQDVGLVACELVNSKVHANFTHILLLIERWILLLLALDEVEFLALHGNVGAEILISVHASSE